MLQYGRKAISVTRRMEVSLGSIHRVTELTLQAEAPRVHLAPPPRHLQVDFRQHSREVARTTRKDRTFEKVHQLNFKLRLFLVSILIGLKSGPI